jgi:Na+-translocating ferredoxin:NAD+ oxidoreductase RNF subunit RnfB
MWMKKEHLVDLYLNRCSGCTRCMRVCPTEALRIREKKVSLMHDQCIYCGNCISSCHKSAFKVTSDSFSKLEQYKVNIAILPLAMYGMITDVEENLQFHQTLHDFGFDEVYDLSKITHRLADKMNDMLNHDIDQPFILTQCPSVIRLVRLNYPSLVNQLLPYDFPFEIGARLARKKYSLKYQLHPDEIGIHYISECLSNYTAIKDPLGKEKSVIDHVFLFQDIFKSLVNHYSQENSHSKEVLASNKGILYAKSGALPKTTQIKEYIAVDGINHVSDILEKVYLDTLPKVKCIEAYSCVGGCVGGTFTFENPFVAKWRVNHYSNAIDELASLDYVDGDSIFSDSSDWYFSKPIESELNDKIPLKASIKKISLIHHLLEQLPKIDCCACGSPTCRALAEDIVKGEKTINDCVVLRTRGDHYES